MKPHFELSPKSGFCKANSEITFTCVFKSTSEAACIQTEVCPIFKTWFVERILMSKSFTVGFEI